MSYDRDEWRRPWRVGDPPVTAATAEDAGVTAHPEVTAHPHREVTAHPNPEVAASSETPAAAADVPPSQVWERPADPSVSTAGATAPIARFPQPPPATWDERSTGPGSPAGSVRPPDTTGTVDAPRAAPRRRNPLVLLLTALLGAAIGTLGTLAALGMLTDEPAADAVPQPVNAPAIEPLSEGSVVPAVAQAVTPSVVRIDVSGESDPTSEVLGGSVGLGSGVIYSSDGYILTNHHVIRGAATVDVRLATGEILEAEVVGSDELNDLAVVRVEATGLPAINLRPDAEPLIVGETVVAIGSPFGLDASVTTGIISALDREIRLDEQQAGAALTIPSVIQTDAAINPGNSGGALVDAQGRLVGINTAILTRSGASQGVGFAVSAEQAVTSAEQLIDQGFVRHPLLGITGFDVSPDDAERFGLEASRGAVVDSVQDGTGADAAGVRPGDIIVELDGAPLATMSELVREVRRRQPGDEVVLGIVRDGEPLTLEVELGERPR